MTARLFVAITLPEEVAEDLAEFVEPRRTVDSALRWTAADRWHITLAFMPAVSDRSYDDLLERLGAAVGRRPPLELALAAGGAFPSADRAKVLYTGVNGDSTELARLSVGVRNAANGAGVTVDGAAFRPHVTLARTSAPMDATRWLRVLDTYSGPSWSATEVELIQSELGAGPRGAARYHTLEVFDLRSSGPR
ncbi:MAG: 2-5 ligase [Frankiales bacterium]|nr:2-5 ligase [Frankiales bacterium]